MWNWGRLTCRSLVVAMLAAPICGAAESKHAYVGSPKCKVCHLRQFNSWSATKMANAFELLKPGAAAEAKKAAKLDPSKDYTTDTTCVGCHVTGYGQKGGFVNVASTPGLAGVGCEVCHGPGGTYIRKEYMSLENKEYKKAELVAVGMVGEVAAAQCNACHNEKSPFFKAFDFAARKKEGTHQVFPLKYKH